jgi:head-tail adaptor
MKKKILTEEIIRIQKMMGVSPKLIMEAGPGGPIAEKGAKELWATIEKLFTREAERGTEEGLEKTLERLESVVGRENVEALDRIIKGTERLEVKQSSIIDYLAKNKIIQQGILDRLEADANYAQEIVKSYDKFIRDPEIKQYLDDMYSIALDRTSGDIEEANRMMKDILGEDVGMKELDRYLGTVKVEELRTGGYEIKFKEETPVENIADTPINRENATDNSAGNGPGMESEEVIENIEELAKKPGTVQQIIQSLVKSFNLRDLQSVLSAWRRAFRGMDKLQAEFNVYADRMEQNIKSGLRYDAEFKKMQDILLAVKKNWAQLPKETYELWLSELPERVKKTMNGVGKTGQEWKFFYNELLKQEEWVTPILNETAAFKKLWPLRMPGSKTKGWFIFKTPTEDLSKRLGNLIVFKDPRTFAEMKSSLMINGVKQDIARTIVSKVATETIVGPIMLATLGQFVRPISAAAEGLYNSITDGDANWIDYNEPDANGNRSSNPFTIIKNDWIQVAKSLMPADVWEAAMDVIDPTFIDEFISDVFSPIITAEKAIEDSEIRKRVREFKDRKSAEYQQWYNQQSEAARRTIDEYTKRLKDGGNQVVEDIVNGEVGFRAWCVKESKSFLKFENNVGYTNDGKQWTYVTSPVKGFVEKQVAPTPQPTGPTIQQFYEYIHSLDGRVGNVDLPYMHQDPSNPNKFTFEWSDSRGTKTYIYNGTTFSEQ